MLVNLLKLKGKMVENGISQDAMSIRLGINRATFMRKMSAGGSRFTVGEINKMAEVLKLNKEDVISIFFVDTVALLRHPQEHDRVG